MDASKPIYLEDESFRIGSVALHKPLYDHMQESPLIVLDVDREERCRFLAEDYGNADPQELREAFVRITKRLGGERLKRALEALDAGDLKTAADIALHYYDQAYDHGISKRSEDQIRRVDCTGSTVNEIAQAVINGH